jgi:hypothetical protein
MSTPAPLVSFEDPNAVNHCLWLIITCEENEAREQRDEALAALLRPTNETEDLQDEAVIAYYESGAQYEMDVRMDDWIERWIEKQKQS